jgi:glycosyltransferase involved in cell wall biosynthesis
MVHKEMPDARLIIVGDGEERGYLEELADSFGIRVCVDFVGKVPHKRIPDYMRQADVFVLSSLSEGFPVTVLEAMAYGLPIVATRVGGLPDIIEDGVNGYLVELRNVEEITNKIAMLLNSPELCRNIYNNNKVKAQRYTWESVTLVLENLYLGLV